MGRLLTGRGWGDENPPNDWWPRPETRRGRKGIYAVLETALALLTPWFWIFCLQDLEEGEFLCLKFHWDPSLEQAKRLHCGTGCKQCSLSWCRIEHIQAELEKERWQTWGQGQELPDPVSEDSSQDCWEIVGSLMAEWIEDRPDSNWWENPHIRWYWEPQQSTYAGSHIPLPRLCGARVWEQSASRTGGSGVFVKLP